jgi:hypothetical protein
MTPKAVLVAGTWAYRGSVPVTAWWHPWSPFATMLETLGVRVLGRRDGERPYVWSTDVDGVPGSPDVDWRAGGAALYEYLVPSLCPDARIPPVETTVVCHSHGLQVVLFAAAAGLTIGHLVSVCSPIREDMAATTKTARPNIGTWTHLYSDASDAWQLAGSDDLSRSSVVADANICIPGVGHTGLVEDEKNFPRWIAHAAWLGVG